jgi:hypothetical protein
MDEPLVETEVADSDPQRRSGPWKLIVIVAVLTLIGVWLVPGDKPEDEPAVAMPPAGEPQADAPTAPSLLAEGSGGEQTEGQPLPTAASELVDNRPGARARAMIARMRADGDVDLDQVVNGAQQAQIAGDLADAYLLYFFAAREGSAAAALELGKQADPASRDPLSSVFEGPDLTQAHKWYQAAAGSGNKEARNRLADLHARVEQLAASGDPQAQRISLLWQ